MASSAPADALWVCRFGGRVALVNESPEPRTVKVTLPREPAGQSVCGYASQRRLARAAAAGPLTVTVELGAYDPRVLGME